MIYLVRHGQTDWNVEQKTQGHTDISLNADGISQAESIAKSILKLKIGRIISSDLLRARETAEIINQSIGVDISFDQRLREINYGDLEGIPRTELTPNTWDVFNETPEKLNAEPMSSVFERIKSFFDELNEHQDNILIVTHGGALRIIMHYAESCDSFDKEKYSNSHQNSKINNASIFQWNKGQTAIQPVFL